MTVYMFLQDNIQQQHCKHKKYVKAVLPGVKFTGMSCGTKPKSMSRAKQWTDEVENLYRFQQAGYRDEMEYRQIKQLEIDWWPETGFVKKLQRRDNTYYYYNRKRECEDKEVHKVKMYAY
ncbi:hypothetical protein AMEX_G2916 [Astyanax mexicanus]|uniref:Meiosis expressed gene 1 protein homolog n=4 Tax=Astyanax mexicanus TaxID=7994 RepID=A0A8B9L1Q8_ASTMX|nr:hypothetical protein AMEX_G2916 [Astyanax mexicanus]